MTAVVVRDLEMDWTAKDVSGVRGIFRSESVYPNPAVQRIPFRSTTAIDDPYIPCSLIDAGMEPRYSSNTDCMPGGRAADSRSSLCSPGVVAHPASDATGPFLRFPRWTFFYVIFAPDGDSPRKICRTCSTLMIPLSQPSSRSTSLPNS